MIGRIDDGNTKASVFRQVGQYPVVRVWITTSGSATAVVSDEDEDGAEASDRINLYITASIYYTLYQTYRTTDYCTETYLQLLQSLFSHSIAYIPALRLD